MTKSTLKFTIAITFIWIGFICSISFMEAWLKFQAPNITTSLGLGIGKLVFGALNKVELFSSFSIMALFIYSNEKLKIKYTFFFTIAFLILIIQTIWLLPNLDERASKIIQGISVPKSQLHFVFIALECIKVICLTLFGKNQLNQLN